MLRDDRGKRVVAARCERAAALGVTEGMPAAQAGAVLPIGARTEPARPERDRAAMRALSAWAQRFSPAAAADPPDGLRLDVTGCRRVFRGERRLAELVREQAKQLGYTARVAIAPTFGCAWAVARFGHDASAVVHDGAVRDALAPLPIDALRLGPGDAQGLGEVGIDRVGDLLRLPRSVLPARVSEEALLRLDQALGAATEWFEPDRPAPPAHAERVFEGPTDRPEAIELTVRELIAEVADALRSREHSAKGLRITLGRSDLPPEQIIIALGAPSRDAAHLWALARPHLERAHLGFGVERVQVAAAGSSRAPHAQRATAWAAPEHEPAHRDHAAGRLLDTLANRLGHDNVRVARLGASHRPERARRFERWEQSAVRTGDEGTTTVAHRPTVLLDRPEPAEVVAVTPGGPVLRVRWSGGSAEVTASRGPERIEPEWWRDGAPADRAARDYFAVRTDTGRWLWVFRASPGGGWFVHGVWA